MIDPSALDRHAPDDVAKRPATGPLRSDLLVVLARAGQLRQLELDDEPAV